MGRLPQVSARDIIQFLKAHDFLEDRQSGSHLTLRNKQTGQSITVPIHTGCDIGRGLAVRILKDSGYTAEDYIDWKRK